MIRCEADNVEHGASGQTQAKISTLDKLIDQIPDGAIIGAMKLDTEGMDYFVIKGGHRFIKTFKPLYIQSEYNPNMMANKGITPQMHID